MQAHFNFLCDSLPRPSSETILVDIKLYKAAIIRERGGYHHSTYRDGRISSGRKNSTDEARQQQTQTRGIEEGDKLFVIEDCNPYVRGLKGVKMQLWWKMVELGMHGC
ncbi:hypothetical protein HanXRQr2_Chr10g0424151 [Helianthus annuus]|uniref:Uncharacterized protein n=2 Tax=Helianthus annuus TaxID=4232 RepID=A0A251TGW0_HELAN|nr:hypothetical protein HanXRQr2_Chr10g0424151 [Helianthus annuus]